ncbi:hypothetical protein MYP_2381 [Sporocytophaga myxococcoides]|uniref:Uncharacterized protein n=1 Tax=Sporocytophaga myxococcoides TaxID=153721 RepID=A0A098LF95_9BACT|nr:hypothetical protein [Sporocytophaga myxococcoides]GAL85152.1 hypothetical protein MYP_2381 [Sporocytophaga myxococcoides]
MKTIKLNSYRRANFPSQFLTVKVVNTGFGNHILGTTGKYPSDFTLPAIFALDKELELHLYKEDHISIQLWGDSTGFIASSTIDMEEYKIIYPIDMETKSDSVSFSVMGSWE